MDAEAAPTILGFCWQLAHAHTYSPDSSPREIALIMRICLGCVCAGGINDAVQVRNNGSTLEAIRSQLSSRREGAGLCVVMAGSATLTDCTLQVRAGVHQFYVCTLLLLPLLPLLLLP